ncbi:DNA cytosine methyltransferase [Umezakia ovalisporum]|jgi:DNA (cytosine-5)-methyltransferase 1|uniref:DNA (cytosine-5-)-methyltransferase n=1 Tax=Umezakia ovalisporum FSS-43 TaxID=2740520 RepID=A0ABT6K2Q6_9CYAN|nr:DNA cytosine methyltransferase [Umezakia ovalisporum]MBI1241735.1 DNA (cytosine-5-)-methyltransferase [Nostoc sp. RI_552]MDH6056574.1 DNA cytosine methyltransferase [Umezakia ovalisporum FSS-43]MDH6067932.1 DNA cytosine methyltransferase [Umezakia ovalisporum APH033B]MDH6069234.1 DNA cytosine methyltransferase [Umezakia ovalisporum CobakiLakeA]MDH6073789.1 DNA cytosine methyltransferase [Umezakia ovalisporum CS-1034]
MTVVYPCVFSFFSGSGFLDLGFETSGFNIVYVNEIFEPFMKAYRYAREILQLPQPEYGYHHGEAADVSKLMEGVEAQRLCDLVKDCRNSHPILGFIGGPPCPDFSVGGKNKGILGDNGKLSACYVELICRNLPDFFLFENVKGLWRTKKHRLFFEYLKHKLIQTGYTLTERLINAIEYGVPQDRERIILVGFRDNFLKDIGINQLIAERHFNWQNKVLYPQEQVFNYPWQKCETFRENSITPCPENIPEELTVEYWFRKNDVLNHPNAQHYFKPRAGIAKFAVVDEGDVSKKSFKRLHRWRYSPTACYGNNEVHLHPYKVRRISVAEALAIQSLPANFILPEDIYLTNMFKTIGNGVPYLASKALAQIILDFLPTGVKKYPHPHYMRNV